MKEIIISKLATFVLGLLNVVPSSPSSSVVHLQGSHVSIAVIDFTTNQYRTIHFQNKKRIKTPSVKWFYDLASLTKPLTMASTYFAAPELFSNEEVLLLNHKGGLPPTFVVDEAPKDSWKQKIQSFQVKESLTKYSDTSAVRLMLNLKNHDLEIPKYFNHWLDKDVKYWRSLPKSTFCPSTGKRNKVPIHCKVHDDKAFKILEFVSHAGLFATVDGVANTLLNLNNSYKLNSIMAEKMPEAKEQFLNGWEVNKNLESKPGGQVDDHVFGHRGYTGTSIWINTDLNVGVVILTNTSSLQNGKNNKIIAQAKHELREKITTYLWTHY